MGKVTIERINPAQQPSAPKTHEFWQIRVLGEAEADVQKFKRKLDGVDIEMRRFTFAHMITLGTQLYFRAQGTDDRARLVVTWNEIVSRRERILKKWMAAVARLQSIKQHREEQETKLRGDHKC